MKSKEWTVEVVKGPEMSAGDFRAWSDLYVGLVVKQYERLRSLTPAKRAADEEENRRMRARNDIDEGKRILRQLKQRLKEEGYRR